MPDIFKTHDKIKQAISLFSSSGDAKREQGIAILRQWLRETDLEIARFEADMEKLAEENYQMTIMERGLVKY